MTSNDDILRAFFQVNVQQGKLELHEFEKYVNNVIQYGIAVIAQANRGRINPEELLNQNFIATTEEKIFGIN